MLLHALLAASLALSSRSLEFGSLQLPAGVRGFDPAHAETQMRLTAALGVQAMSVEPLATNGGANGGVWIVSDPFRNWGDLVVKLRLAAAQDAWLPTEVQQVARLAEEHPELSQDPSLAFPSKIIACSDAGNRKIGDLIVARRAHGMMIAYFIAQQYYSRDAGAQVLDAVFAKIGHELRAFHNRYGKMHCDFQTANIMVDPADAHRIVILDLAMMGSPGHHNDIAHFRHAIELLIPSYPPASWLQNAFLHFERGYRGQDIRALEEILPQASPPAFPGRGQDIRALDEHNSPQASPAASPSRGQDIRLRFDSHASPQVSPPASPSLGQDIRLRFDSHASPQAYPPPSPSIHPPASPQVSPPASPSLTNLQSIATSISPACQTLGPSSSRWQYEPENGRSLSLRANPSTKGTRTGEKLQPGEVFDVVERVAGLEDELLLRLADGRGWAFDKLPGVGRMCVLLCTREVATPSSSRWRYEPQNGKHLSLRAQPSIAGTRTVERLQPGDIFDVVERFTGPDGEVFLRLADGRGWAFEELPGVGQMCVLHSDE